jgi:predicted short-subunit dehydrogenase-like oxidoreductase (DUF2520 family)
LHSQLHAPAGAPGAIGIIGTGPVARALGRLLCDHGEPVAAVASRSRSRAEETASFMGRTVMPATAEELPAIATRILVVTSDDAITPMATRLAAAGLDRGVALHTCGALGADALAPLQTRGVSCGVLHPLQSFAAADAGAAHLAGITFGISGDPAARDWGASIARMAGSRAVTIAEGRMATYHAGAVLASNALVALIDAAVVLMTRAGIDADAALEALGPLSRTTLDNVVRLGPMRALTGPIVRGNAATVSAHMSALAAAPADVSALYRAAGVRLLDLARRRGLSETSLHALAAALETSHSGETDGPETRPHT